MRRLFKLQPKGLIGMLVCVGMLATSLNPAWGDPLGGGDSGTPSGLADTDIDPALAVLLGLTPSAQITHDFDNGLVGGTLRQEVFNVSGTTVGGISGVSFRYTVTQERGSGNISRLTSSDFGDVYDAVDVDYISSLTSPVPTTVDRSADESTVGWSWASASSIGAGNVVNLFVQTDGTGFAMGGQTILSGTSPQSLVFNTFQPTMITGPGPGPGPAPGGAPIPEPSTMLLLGTGLAGLALWRRHQRSSPKRAYSIC